MSSLIFFIIVFWILYYFNYDNAEYRKKTKENIKSKLELIEELLKKEDKHEDYFYLKNLRNQKQEYLQSDKWNTLRKQVLRRDQYQCLLCAKTSKLNVHHITYKHLFNENIDELKTLCSDCHTNLHKQLGFPSQFDIEEFNNQVFWSDEFEQIAKNTLNNKYNKLI